MSWTLAAGAVLLVLLVVARMRANRWIHERWLANEITDRRAKALLFLATFGPNHRCGSVADGNLPVPQQGPRLCRLRRRAGSCHRIGGRDVRLLIQVRLQERCASGAP